MRLRRITVGFAPAVRRTSAVCCVVRTGSHGRAAASAVGAAARFARLD